MYMYFSEMNISLALVDRAEIEQLEPFLKENTAANDPGDHSNEYFTLI